MSNTATESRPKLSEVIVGLADETFDRVQSHLDRYAEDARRLGSDGSLILKAHESVMYGPERHYGYLLLKVCNQQAAADVLAEIADSGVMRERFPKYVLGRVGNVFRDSTGWEAVGSLPFFRVRRERLPQGIAENHWMKLTEEEESREWGDIHRIGARVVSLYRHSSLPIAETYIMDMDMTSRFDEEWPRMNSNYNVGLVVNDGKSRQEYCLGDDEGLPFVPYSATEEIAGFLSTAKDLRPVVDSIDEHTQYKETIADMFPGLKQ